MFTQLRVAPECGLEAVGWMFPGKFLSKDSRNISTYTSVQGKLPSGEAAIVYRGGTLEAAVGAL